MADRDLLSIVWGETSGLRPKDGADAARARLQTVVAKLAAAAKRRGMDGRLRRTPAPRADDPAALAAYAAMEKTVDAVEADTFRPDTPLPARAVLWEVNGQGLPRRDKPLPDA